MNNESLKKHFQAMGARVKFHPAGRTSRRRIRSTGPFSIDIGRDKYGEFFDIEQEENAPEFELLQIKPKERHLLLYTRDGQRFLCGHDERHWFVAGISGAVSTVRSAKQSLMPAQIMQQVKALPPGEVDNRRNAVFKRQGEWFFIPTNREFDESLVLFNEPLQRTVRSQPHICQEIYREGGELVYIMGLREYSEYEFKKLQEKYPNIHKGRVRTMVKNPHVYARGHVKHKDHATIHLAVWHRVLINAEFTTSAVSFLD